MPRFTEVTCTKCGWVHVGLTEAELKSMVEGPLPMRHDKCFRCGAASTNMRLAREGDAPRGCTLQSILLPEHLVR